MNIRIGGAAVYPVCTVHPKERKKKREQILELSLNKLGIISNYAKHYFVFTFVYIHMWNTLNHIKSVGGSAFCF